MTKSKVQTITKFIPFVILAIFIALITVGTNTLFVANAESIEYNNTIAISYADGVYSYGNNGSFLTQTSLQAVFDDISAKATANVIVEFDNFETAEQIVLSSEKIVVLTGQVKFVGEGSFITVSSGELRVQGASINAVQTAITVENGAVCNLLSGSVKTTASDKNFWFSTIVNKGALVIDGGAVRFEHVDDNRSGYAIQQNSRTATLTMTKGIVEGNSGIDINQGLVTISGGSVNATQPFDKNTLNGCAVRVSNDGNLKINGGSISSVTPRHAVLLEGGSSSSAEYISGEINGRIRFGYGGSNGTNTKLKIADKTVYSVQNGNVEVFSDNGKIDATTDPKVGVECKDGYYVESWCGNITEQTPYLKDFAQSDITVTLNNLYKINLILGDQTKEFTSEYGSKIYPDILYFVAPDGFVIDYWQDSDGKHYEAPLDVKKSTTYTAVMSIAPHELPVFENIKKEYDGIPETISANVSEHKGITYLYEWQREDTLSVSDGHGGISIYNEFVTKSTENTFTYSTVSQSGKYRLRLTMTAGKLQSVQYGNEFLLLIEKGYYYSVTAPALNGVYDKNKTLADYDLPDGFYWENEKIVPTVSVCEYSAFYCLDKENYNPESVTVALTLEKAKGVEQVYGVFGYYPGNFVYNPQKTLADYELSSGWRWQDESIVPSAGDKSYIAFYNPDSENYADYQSKIAISMSKAKYDSANPVELKGVYKENLTLGDVIDRKLSSEYFLKEYYQANYVFTEIGTFVFDLYYNADADNYSNYQTTLTVIIEKGIVEREYATRCFIVWADSLTLEDIELESGYSWENPDTAIRKELASYRANYNPNSALYNDYSLEIEVLAYDSSIVSHSEITAVYRENLRLSDIALEKGFSWTNPETVLFAGTHYIGAYAEYLDYGLVPVAVKVVVEKGSYDMSKAIFDDLTVDYDGRYHSITLQGFLPVGVSVDRYYCIDQNETSFVDSGVYEYVVTFTQADSENYNSVSPLTATLTINKIDYDLTAFWSDYTVTYDGKKHVVPLADLPDGVRLVEYIDNVGYTSSGTYSVGAVFEQDDAINHNILGTVYVTLTIEKAIGSIAGDKIQKVVYDGTEKSPSAFATTDEQTVMTNDKCVFVEPGKYKVTYYIEESANYKGATKEIEFIILAKVIVATSDGKDSLEGRLYSENGIESGELAFDVSDNDKNGVRFVVKMNGEPIKEKYVITVSLPKNLKKGSVVVYAVCSDGTYAIDYTRDGDEIIFFASGNEFIISPAEIEAIPSWGWALIGIGIAIAVIVIVVAVWIILKKKKNIDIFSWMIRKK